MKPSHLSLLSDLDLYCILLGGHQAKSPAFGNERYQVILIHENET